MKKNIHKKRSQATVCANRLCVTVHDDTADFVNALVTTVVLVAATAALVKILS